MSSTRREPSLRTCARVRYLTAAEAAGLAAPPAPPPVAEPSLSERVRALYEGAVVPVREIAKLVGVSEHTIYKYARRLGWKARVRWLKPVARGRAHLPLERVRALYEESCLPVREVARLAGVSDVTVNNYARKLGWQRRARRLAKGAGGRFVPLAQAGLPHPRGLKALDPASARRAAERCARAGALADEAAAAAAGEAELRAARLLAERAAQAARLAAERDAQARLRTFERLNAALVELARFLIAFCAEPDSEHTRRAERLAARLQRAIAAQIERLLTPA